MSSYGSVAITGPASRISRVVQSAEPGDLAARANSAIAALPPGYTVVALALAGAGDGHTFTITIEAGAAANTTGGFFAAPPVISCFLASEQNALLLSRAPAGPAAGTFADTQVAGAGKGTRFMGMVVEGVVASDGAVGAGLLSWTTDDGDPANGFPRLFNAPNGVVDENQNQYPVPYNCTVSQLTCRSTKGNVAANRQFTVPEGNRPRRRREPDPDGDHRHWHQPGNRQRERLRRRPGRHALPHQHRRNRRRRVDRLLAPADTDLTDFIGVFRGGDFRQGT